jgi:hypothetical protein
VIYLSFNLIAAHWTSSAIGTFQTWSDVRLESVVRTKADVGRLSRYFIGAAGQFWNCKKTARRPSLYWRFLDLIMPRAPHCCDLTLFAAGAPKLLAPL